MAMGRKRMTAGSQSGVWKLEDAKARLSALVRAARTVGPQRVTVHGRDAVVVIATGDYEKLAARKGAPNLHALLAASPLRDIDFGSEGEKSPVREVGF